MELIGHPVSITVFEHAFPTAGLHDEAVDGVEVGVAELAETEFSEPDCPKFAGAQFWKPKGKMEANSSK